MITASSTAQTASASKFLQQLCKHFAHKVPATWEAARGEVTFSFGFCRMEASDDCLMIHCQADDVPKMKRMKAVLDDHFERFAWREELKLQWRSNDPARVE